MELRGHTLRDQPLPEANITGMTIYAFILEVKKLELLAELVPQAYRHAAEPERSGSRVAG
jgi:hypothetical protein